MKIIKYTREDQKFFTKYAIVLFDNYKALNDKMEVEIVCKILNDRWYRKLFVNRWWYIPVVVFNIKKRFSIQYCHMWYDIQLHTIDIGFLSIYWEGNPEIDYNKKVRG